MRLQVKGKNVEVSDSLKDYAAQKLGKLDKNRPVAVYCDSGYRASLAASLLLRRGFKEVFNVVGSWKAWTAQKLAVERPKERKKASETNLG